MGAERFAAPCDLYFWCDLSSSNIVFLNNRRIFDGIYEADMAI